MIELYGGKYSRANFLRRVGSTLQVAGTREYSYSSGRAAGVRAVEINTGRARFEILPDHCLDIGFASCDQLPLGYISKSGISHPAYYNKTAPTGFHESFLAGLLTTCGLNNIGPETQYHGQTQEMHGKIHTTPAEKVSVRDAWGEDGAEFSVAGEIRHGTFYGGDLVLRRKISTSLGSTRITIEDEVENLDFSPAPCLLLYHVQFGFPFLDAGSRLLTSQPRSVEVRPGCPQEALETHTTFTAPKDDENEVCFYHTLTPDTKGWATACIFNPNLGAKGMGAFVRFHTETLPLLVQWKMLRSREYVCGLEPTTARLDQRSEEEMAACTLQPLEKRRFYVEMGVIEGEDGFQALIND